MPRFAYNRQYQPPAPTLPVQVSHLFDSQRSEDFEGKLDTGADSTVIPTRLVTQFDLMPAGLKRIRSYDGVVRTVRTYYVRIQILEKAFVVKVTAADRRNVLLGRDLLNQFNLYLHGRALVFEIKPAMGSFGEFITIRNSIAFRIMMVAREMSKIIHRRMALRCFSLFWTHLRQFDNASNRDILL